MSLTAVILALTSTTALTHSSSLDGKTHGGYGSPATDSCNNSWDCPGNGRYCYRQDNWHCSGQGSCCARGDGIGAICQDDGDCYRRQHCSKGYGEVNGSCQQGTGPSPTPPPVPRPRRCQYDRECGGRYSGAYCRIGHGQLWGQCRNMNGGGYGGRRMESSDDVARRLAEPFGDRLGATNVYTPARDQCETAWQCQGYDTYCFPQDDYHCDGQGTCCAWSQNGEGALCDDSDDCYGYALPDGNPNKQHCLNGKCRSLLYTGRRLEEESTAEDQAEDLEVEEIEL